MLDIPLNKVLAAVRNINNIKTCQDCDGRDLCNSLACDPYHRKDGKNVIFKLVERSNDKEGQCAEN